MTRLKLLSTICVCLCLSAIQVYSQTPIFSENFDTCAGAYSEYGVHSDGSSDYFLRTNGTVETIGCAAPTVADNGFTNTSGFLALTNTNGFYYTGEDTDRTENPNQSGGAFGSGANSGGVHFNDIDVSAFTNVQIKCSFAARNDSPTVGTFELGDGVKIYVDKTNNGTYELIAAFGIVETPELFGNQYLSLDTDFDGYGEGTILTSAFQEFTFDIAGATTMDVRIELVSTGSNEEIAFDTFVVQGSPASTLSPGDIVFTGYNSRGTDYFSFMATTDIPEDTEIRFTDRGWTSSGTFRTGDGAEGEILYTVAAGGLSAGDQVVIDVATPSVASGTGSVAAVSSAISFSTVGDQVLAFSGTAGTPTTFLAGLQMNNGAWEADATANTSSSLPTGLTSGTTGFVISPEVDGAVYNCTVISGTAAVLKAAVFDQNNWITDNADPITLPCGPSTPTSAVLAASVLLEGAYNGTDLNTTLNASIPTTQPYSINGHTGGTASSIPANAVDWVLVELREAASAAAAVSSTKVGSAAGFLMNDGSIKASDGTSDLTISLSDNSGSAFFVVVYHRNHLAIMSATAISESGGTYSIDFTTLSANTYQTTTALTTPSTGKFPTPPGD
ncbi:MAG: hypothetical protein HEP71_16865, partial [Roseivirga sp.]|nr:hypothetical protein [Roseivirga sp.]